MVSVARPPAASADVGDELTALVADLPAEQHARLARALALGRERYGDGCLSTGEGVLAHARGLAGILAALRLDAETRMAGLLFAVDIDTPQQRASIESETGTEVGGLIAGATRLTRMRIAADTAQRLRSAEQAEVLRKMLLAMVEDVRVVLIRLASRTQSLRYYVRQPPGEERRQCAQETLDLLAPLANRLGVWPLKWELEDLSFRILDPDTYIHLARSLEAKRVEREAFIREAIARLHSELAAQGLRCEISGRPKHIYSIYQKMRRKHLPFDEVYDVRALRVLVAEVADCYTALGVVHNLWQPIPREFDDYISRPKGNHYRSLHTAVIAADGRALEVQIRTHAMHRDAELGIAAHWRYKEGSKVDSYDTKIAFLRQLLAWKADAAADGDWGDGVRQAALDDTVYVFTPQGRVLALPQGATPVDFAYALHTDLGHRCRGAKVNGAMVPLHHVLASGEQVEIIAAKQGGPSRDWLNVQLRYLASSRARAKVRQWFNAQEQAETLASGRQVLERLLKSAGARDTNLEQLASALGLRTPDELFVAAARGEITQRQVNSALAEPVVETDNEELTTRPAKAGRSGSDVLVVGMDNLLTQLAKCCRPVPPDAIAGFVTRGRGIAVHRASCANYSEMVRANPERVTPVSWGVGEGRVFEVNLEVLAADRKGLLRDISEVLTRERLNVTAVNTQSRSDRARMAFTVEVSSTTQLDSTLTILRQVPGVLAASRR